MLEKKYDHQKVEAGKYTFWLDNELFKSGKDLNKKPYCIVIPPPNVTGKLHLGHAWNTTLQDIMIRYKRMDGYDALWLPGMDHAGIATQAKVDARLRSEGKNPREMDRNVWLKSAFAWKEEYASIIRNQWAKLGLSLDYSKERFTMDEGLSKAVNEVFIKLYNKGYIYQGERIINFDPAAMTALSNIEVIYKEVEGAFYHLKYVIEGTDEYLNVATTRPETIFGDTALAVNPNDERYKKYVGKYAILPLVGRKIPIIADMHADMEFGTGVVKITPAHDPNDFEVGLRHNLERILVMNENGTMNELAGIYNGMDRFKCREEVVKELDKNHLLLEVHKIMHNVGFSERTDVMVEPYLSKQWFVRMDELAKNALEVQKDKDKKVNFVPKRSEKLFTNWMEGIQDWCISRQLWWGHRIPAWYKDDEIKVQIECPGTGWVQDNDVLDTWFSSALWPFSTLGWPDNFDNRYFPNNLLVTAYDIIFFWVARMIFQSLEFTDKRPFDDVLIHGLVRDKDGRKMSKSLGNGIDPMDVIDKYGADALRYFLTTSSSPGQDLRYDEEKVKSTWNFINKLWNASRFVLMNLEDFTYDEYGISELTIVDKWLLTKRNKVIKEVRKNMDKYEFNNVGSVLYNFIWDDFCDNYIELVKGNFTNTSKTVIIDTLTIILKILHPLMPFVTEEIYLSLPLKASRSIMISSYPTFIKSEIYEEETKIVDKILEDIVAIRNHKAQNKINKDAKVMLSCCEPYKEIYMKALKISKEDIVTNKDKMFEVNYKSAYIDITYLYEKSMDDNFLKQEEIEKLKASITKREQLLANTSYINKAPEAIVKKDQDKLAEEKAKLVILEEAM